jgi:hypothetical protein
MQISAIDDLFCGVRCGHLLSSQYVAGLVPDFALVSKSLPICMIVRVRGAALPDRVLRSTPPTEPTAVLRCAAALRHLRGGGSGTCGGSGGGVGGGGSGGDGGSDSGVISDGGGGGVGVTRTLCASMRRRGAFLASYLRKKGVAVVGAGLALAAKWPWSERDTRAMGLHVVRDGELTIHFVFVFVLVSGVLCLCFCFCFCFCL